MKFLKKIAFGTMTSALLLFNTLHASADMITVGLSGSAHKLSNTKFFGEKPKGEGQTSAPEHGFMDGIGYAVCVNVDYQYEINEYLGVGPSFGVQFNKNGMEVKETKKGNASMGILQLQGGFNITVLPLGEKTLFLEFCPQLLLNVFGTFGNASLAVDKAKATGTNSHLSADKINEDTGKALNMFNLGGKAGVGYDFRQLIDFPLSVCLEFGITSIMNMFSKEMKTDNKSNNNDNTTSTTTKTYHTILGKKLTESSKDENIHPGVGMTLGVKLGIDLGYYIYGA